MSLDLSRRGFLEALAALGVTATITPAHARTHMPAPAFPLSDRRRFDALTKVTGSKTFSLDFRAKDMGWAGEQAHAFLIYADTVERVVAGVDIAALGDLKPDRIVRQEDLDRDGLRWPKTQFYGPRLFVPDGQTAQFLSEPVAMLIYRDFDRFDAAKRRARSTSLVRYGAASAPPARPHYGNVRFVRKAGESAYGDDQFSPYKNKSISGEFEGDEVRWPAPSDDSDDGRGMRVAQDIALRMDSPAADELVINRKYFSPSIDPAALEPDNGLGWLSDDALHLMVATQSPWEVATVAAHMLASANKTAKKVDLKVAYTVGYGVKEHHVHSLYVILAALYGDGHSVRLAHDRFEQFRMGIKRHAFDVDHTMLVHRGTGKIQAFKSSLRSNGGARQNFSMTVSTVAAGGSPSVYYIPQVDVASVSLATRAVEGGSMRGFGNLQSMAATEMLVDEIAETIGMDAIALRKANVMKTGMLNLKGLPAAGVLRNDELLDWAADHKLWTDRAARKAAFERDNPGRRYGVGFAIAQKNFGTGAEASFATLSFDAEGALSLRHPVHEIGTGATSTQLRLVEEILGVSPHAAEFGVTEWPELELDAGDDPYTSDQAAEDAKISNPRWTPRKVSPMSASNGAYFHGHATRQAAEVLKRVVLIPAARRLWSRGFGGGALAANYVADDAISVKDGMVAGAGMPAIPAREVLKHAHAAGLPTGVVVHTFNRWQWAEATFPIEGHGALRLGVDALALRYGDAWRFIERSEVFYPPVSRNGSGPTYYAPMATFAEVSVETATGEVRVLSHHSMLECGRVIVPEFVSGQTQGALAQGIGHALTEYLPLYEDGPADGTWNFHRYKLPRASDVAVWSQTLEVLPPLSPTDPPKGMAEVVMIAIVPAIANAVHHAIGRRFYQFPISRDRVLEALA